MSWGWLVIVAIVAYWLGYAAAHTEVARECERLGSFYVGKKTYHCVNINAAPTTLRPANLVVPPSRK